MARNLSTEEARFFKNESILSGIQSASESFVMFSDNFLTKLNTHSLTLFFRIKTIIQYTSEIIGMENCLYLDDFCRLFLPPTKQRTIRIGRVAMKILAILRI